MTQPSEAPLPGVVGRVQDMVDRVRRDTQRFVERVREHSQVRYEDTLDGWKDRLFEIDSILAEAVSIGGTLLLVRSQLYSGGLTESIFEQLKMRKFDFGAEVSDSQEYFRGVMYSFTEEVRTARELLKYHIRKEELSARSGEEDGD